MTKIVELDPDDSPPPLGRYAMVAVVRKPSVHGRAFVDHASGRTYVASEDEADIADKLAKAKKWAAEKGIPNVYLQREGS